MGLLTAIKKRLPTQYAAVTILEESCDIKVRRYKNDKEVFAEEKHFSIPSKERLSDEVVVYLQRLQAEEEQTYIALFLNTHGQGVVPSCKKSEYEKFHIDYNHVKDICVENRFSVYASDIDIKWTEKIFARTGLDFIFSPFLILEGLRKASPHGEGVSLYMLVSKNAMTLMIFADTQLLYGTFVNFAKEEDLLASDFEEEDMGTETDEDIFDEIDLDMELEESEEIADILHDVEEEVTQKAEKDIESVSLKSRLFGEELRMVKYFDASLREFYESDLYESDFITYVRIYNAMPLNPDVLAYLQEQLLVEIDVVPVDIADEVIRLAREEVAEGA